MPKSSTVVRLFHPTKTILKIILLTLRFDCFLIVFSDTDSVFVKFPKVDGETPLESRQRTLRLAQEMEQKINFDGTFKAPNFLEYEVSVLSKCPRYFASLCL